MRKEFLRSILAQESRAYGFTLSFWGSGALLIGKFGVPNLLEILLYVFGAVIGFGILAIIAFRQAFSTVEYEEPQYLVLSMIHYIAALAPIIITNYLLTLDHYIAFVLSGVTVSTVYNLLMLAEERVSRKALKIEKRLLKI